METLDHNIQSESKKLHVSQDVKQNLLTTAKWTRFMAIISFVFCGLLGIASLFMLIGTLSSGNSLLMYVTFLYIALTVVMIFPGLYLIRFTTGIEQAFHSDKQVEFEYGIQNMKSFFKFTGIYAIVTIVLYIFYIFFLLNASRF